MSKFTQYTPTSGAGSGDVTGPASSVDENIAIFDGTTGKVIKDGLVGLPQSDGELIIGDTAGNAQTATLTGGTGITVTNGAGSVTIDADNNGDVTAAASLDDFAVVCGDGGAKGVQTIASVGTTGQVLTSNGAGALPTFEDAGAAGLEFIESQTASNVASIEFTGFEFFNKYMLSFAQVQPSIDGGYILLEKSNDGGSTWVTTGYQGSCIHFAWNGTTATSTNSTSHWVLSGPVDSSSSIDSANGQIWISPRGATVPWVNGTVSFGDATGVARLGNVGGSGGSTGVDALRIRASSGNLQSGQFVLYGMRQS